MDRLPAALVREYNESRTIQNTSLFCQAPFNSIYFLPRGEAVPCCYNRSDVYGRYPENSLRETWFGSAAVRFRESILEHRLRQGCHLCASQLEARNFTGIHTRIFDFDLRFWEEKQLREVGPASITELGVMPEILEFELHNTCNLECVMCHEDHSSAIRKNRAKLPAIHSPYDQGFVEQLREFVPHVKLARFLGGEPFLIRIYYPIWELFAELNPQAECHITTNGTILNARVRNLLERIGANIIMSMDSLVKETYEPIRIHAKYERLMENLEYFSDYCHARNKILTFACCPMQQNWTELPAMVRFCNEKGVGLYHNTVEWPVDNSLRFLSEDRLDEIVEFWQGAVDCGFEDHREPRHPWHAVKTFDFHDIDARRRSNVANFQGAINQVKLWRQRRRHLEVPPPVSAGAARSGR